MTFSVCLNFSQHNFEIYFRGCFRFSGRHSGYVASGVREYAQPICRLLLFLHKGRHLLGVIPRKIEHIYRNVFRRHPAHEQFSFIF